MKRRWRKAAFGVLLTAFLLQDLIPPAAYADEFGYEEISLSCAEHSVNDGEDIPESDDWGCDEDFDEDTYEYGGYVYNGEEYSGEEYSGNYGEEYGASEEEEEETGSYDEEELGSESELQTESWKEYEEDQEDEETAGLGEDGTSEGEKDEMGYTGESEPDGAESGEEPALPPETYSGETLIPSERTEEQDLIQIVGEGIIKEIDPDVDAVKEVQDADPADTGILQLAAEESGKAREALEDAALAVGTGEQVEPAVEESLKSAQADPETDRQNGIPVKMEPASDKSSAMAWLSSFILSKVRDGAGDFDERTDLLGNDSDENNRVIRTNDDITYVFSYSTALGDRYMYNTVSGTKLYLAYSMPFGRDEAEFNTDAMPWLKGDGPDGKPVVTETDGRTTIIGYRDLPDRVSSEGYAYDVPGAGTVNCVIKVKDLKSGTEIRPTFHAWLEKTDNSAAAEDELTLAADVSGTDPACKVSVGPYLSISIEKNSKVTQVGHGISDDTELIDLSTGGTKKLIGSSRVFYYAVRCGKINGSIKGVDSIDASKRIHIEAAPDWGVNKSVATDLAFFDVRTLSMVTEEGTIRGVFHHDRVKNPIEAEVPDEYGEIPKDSVKVGGGRVAFDVTGFLHNKPGEIVTQGTVTFQQREDQRDAFIRPIYWAALRSKVLKATPILTGEGERDFDNDSVFRIQNQTDPSGRWDSHIILGSIGLNYPVSSSNMSTDGAIGYGMNFVAYMSTSFFPGAEAEYEKSRDYYMLWDNRKVGLREGGESVILTALDEGAVYRYLTKADGGEWKDDNEMYGVDFTSSSMFDTLRVWPDYESAAAFLSGIHPGEENPDRYICGVICEAHEVPLQKIGVQYYQRVGVKMKVLPIPENIGTTSVFIQAVRTYGNQITTSYSSATGIGTDPAEPGKYTLRNWNLSPMEYEPTLWGKDGALIPSSLTELNTLHKGTTLYIMPYTLKVSECFENELEAITFDLSKADDMKIFIRPAFEGITHVQGAEAIVDVKAIRDKTGKVLTSDMTLYGMKSDGSEVLLEEGKEYKTGDFVPGSEGTFTIEKTDLADPYNGCTFRVRNAANPDLALAVSGGSGESGAPVILSGSTGSSAEWLFTKKGNDLYEIKNSGSGKLLYDAAPAVQQIVRSQSDQIPSLTWRVIRNADGTVSFVSGGTGGTLGPDGGQAGSSVRMSTTGDPENMSSRWKVVSVKAPDEDAGIRVIFKALDSSCGLPKFYLLGKLDKSLITGDTMASHETVISGDSSTETPSKNNGHLAAVSSAFTEIMANTIRETVDKDRIMPDEELTYTIYYTNHYDADHPVDITDLLPADGDGGFADVSPHSEGEVEEDLTTHVGEKTVFTIVPGSITCEADKGSSVTAKDGKDRVTVSGTLKSGENLTVTYKVKADGLKDGDVIRNSCTQKDRFGQIWSNRVETRVGTDPRLQLHMTLMTGGSGGRMQAYMFRLFLTAAVLMAAVAVGRKRKKVSWN